MADELSEQLEADLLGNSSKTPRENWAVGEILRLRKLLSNEPVSHTDFMAAHEQKHGKAGKGSTAKVADKSE